MSTTPTECELILDWTLGADDRGRLYPGWERHAARPALALSQRERETPEHFLANLLDRGG